MITILKQPMWNAECNDAVLVAASLGGDRNAFARIVERYQSLVCSLAYSATGSLTQSEDLAQETFLIAWRELSALREPEKLKSWICGIARRVVANTLRREQREPVQTAESMESLAETPGSEPCPVERVITREEESILWRSLEQIPETYREPLVLFYRQGESVAGISEVLGLSEEAVKQRLSRGRRLLQESVAAFVEGALKQSNPGQRFTASVMAAIPGYAMTSTVAAVAGKGGTAKAGVSVGAMFLALLGPLLAIFGTWMSYKVHLATAQGEEQKKFISKFYRLLMWLLVVGFVLVGCTFGFARWLLELNPKVMIGVAVFDVVFFVGATLALTIWAMRTQGKLCGGVAVKKAGNTTVYEYRSQRTFLGLPLVHIRMGRTPGAPRAVKAWISVGDVAVGGLFALGGVAVAPISFGGFGIGLVTLSGFALGGLAIGGFCLGWWAVGGFVVGWMAIGGFAAGWPGAVGGVAIAREYALGAVALAREVNTKAALSGLESLTFFRVALPNLKYMAWLNVVWLLPVVIWWKMVKKKANQ